MSKRKRREEKRREEKRREEKRREEKSKTYQTVHSPQYSTIRTGGGGGGGAHLALFVHELQEHGVLQQPQAERVDLVAQACRCRREGARDLLTRTELHGGHVELQAHLNTREENTTQNKTQKRREEKK
jgi:hypothetical protein